MALMIEARTLIRHAPRKRGIQPVSRIWVFI
jgi:hypothetical protein